MFWPSMPLRFMYPRKKRNTFSPLRCAETAAVLNLPVGTVKSRVFHARAGLHEWFDAETTLDHEEGLAPHAGDASMKNVDPDHRSGGAGR